MGSFFSSDATASAVASSESSRVLDFHSSSEWKNHLASIQDSSTLMVIDFTATWCGPCKMMEPVFNELSNKNDDIIFARIDVDELTDVAREFAVQAMPTFVLVKKGKPVDKVIGGKKDELRRKIAIHKH